jgi:uncharacterized protein
MCTLQGLSFCRISFEILQLPKWVKYKVLKKLTGMTEVDPRIVRFLHKHHIFTLATSSGNVPYVSTCFYVYLEKENIFIFTTDKETRHAAEMIIQPRVAGAIALETKVIGRIQGIQFTGTAKELDGQDYKTAHSAYLWKFPYAGFKHLVLWSVVPDFIKMTHNQLGFGKKLIWTV